MVSKVIERPHFTEGQVVQHRSKGYRGVVVAIDRVCRGPHLWPLGIRSTQFSQEAWYHLLVDGGEHSVYLSQSSLAASTGPIEHPDIESYFDGFDGHVFARNDVSWDSPW